MNIGHSPSEGLSSDKHDITLAYVHVQIDEYFIVEISEKAYNCSRSRVGRDVLFTLQRVISRHRILYVDLKS